MISEKSIISLTNLVISDFMGFHDDFNNFSKSMISSDFMISGNPGF